MKKFGYTIAETIITMGIVGIIAALTIPSFVTDYRKQTYSKLLVSAVADFENAMMIMMKKEGIDDLLYSESWSEIITGRSYSLNSNSTDNTIENFKREITKVLPIDSYETAEWSYFPLDGNRAISERNLVRFKTKQGIVYGIRINERLGQAPRDEREALMNNCEYINRAAERVMIDINGENMPNREGRDIFYYELSTDGHLYPLGSKDHCFYNYARYREPSDLCVRDRNGEFCAAYLKLNNYQMDY